MLLHNVACLYLLNYAFRSGTLQIPYPHVRCPACLVAASLVAAVLAISFIFPWQLVNITKYKAKINGPWDEAIPVLPKQLHLPLLHDLSERPKTL